MCWWVWSFISSAVPWHINGHTLSNNPCQAMSLRVSFVAFPISSATFKLFKKKKPNMGCLAVSFQWAELCPDVTRMLTILPYQTNPIKLFKLPYEFGDSVVVFFSSHALMSRLCFLRLWHKRKRLYDVIMSGHGFWFHISVSNSCQKRLLLNNLMWTS